MPAAVFAERLAAAIGQQLPIQIPDGSGRFVPPSVLKRMWEQNIRGLMEVERLPEKKVEVQAWGMVMGYVLRRLGDRSACRAIQRYKTRQGIA